MRISDALSLQIWGCLVSGESLNDLALGSVDGRVDLRGLNLPKPTELRRFQFQGSPIVEVEPGASLRSLTWRDLDLSGSKLGGLRIFGCEFDNCRFDHCHFQDFRVWATTFSNCTFTGANLRGAMLGGVLDGKRTRYIDVGFADADLSETVYKAAAFVRCTFRNAKLRKVDFQSTTFEECMFEGELRDVLFYRQGFQGEAYPANEMSNVDFSRAKLHDVGFRGLALDRVKLPEDADHIVIRDPSSTLNRLVEALHQHGDAAAKDLIRFLSIYTKWMAPNQAQMVINANDLAETLGIEAVTRLRELLASPL